MHSIRSRHEESCFYTRTSNAIGRTQWRVVVVGLRNGVQIFQRVVEWCLREFADNASAYVEGNIVVTAWHGSREATIAQHERDVTRVMEALKANKLVADSRKCKFLWKRWSFAAIFWGGKRRTAPAKLMALKKIGGAQDRNTVTGFFGLHQLLLLLCGGVCPPFG